MTQNADTGGRYDRKVLVEVLIYHWPTNTSGCGCGWAELGHSHAEHVADVYEASVAHNGSSEAPCHAQSPTGVGMIAEWPLFHVTRAEAEACPACSGHGPDENPDQLGEAAGAEPDDEP